MVEIVELPVIGQLVLGQPDADRIEGFAELRRAGGEIDAVKPDLDRRDATPDPIHKAPAAHLVEHADLVDQPQRMIERQQIDHRPKAQLPGPLRHGGQETRLATAHNRAACCGARPDGSVEPGAIICLDQLQPILEMPVQRHARCRPNGRKSQTACCCLSLSSVTRRAQNRNSERSNAISRYT